MRRLLTGLLLVLVVEYLVLPQVAGARKALHLLGRVNVGLLVLGLLLETAALVAYAQLTYSLLPPGPRPSRLTLLRIQLATLAVSHVVPGGAAAGGGLGLDLLTSAGVRGADAGFALATQGMGSALVLNILLWLGLVVSIPLRGFNALYGIAALVGAFLVAALGVLVLLLTRGERRARVFVGRVGRRIPFVNPAALQLLVRQLAVRLQQVASDRRLLATAGGWAAANWLLDAAALWVFLAAFGNHMALDGLIVAYGLANVLAALPITPGGLGVVEAVLTSTLVGFGAPRGEAILGVVSWRLVNFWLPIPVGALTYLSLRVRPGAPPAERAEELYRLAERSQEEAGRFGRWSGPLSPD